MKKNSILIVGLGVPSELTDVLLREGCDILRSETPLQAALVLLRGDAQAVLTVGDLGEEWLEFTDVALTDNHHQRYHVKRPPQKFQGSYVIRLKVRR